MKKHIFNIALALCTALGLASCYSDNSSMGDPDSVGKIEIAEMDPQSIISYAGNFLQITPEINSTYPDDDLEYGWYIYTEWTDQENGFRENCISNDRNLNYEMNMPSGSYTLAFEVGSKSTGFKQQTKTTVAVSTEFSDAFYILKETAEGKTELDMISDNSSAENLLTKMFGAPMEGQPVSLAMLYQQQYVDSETQEMGATNAINVFSTEDYYALRTEDMKKIFDRKSISYAGEENTEKYLNICNGFFYAFMISDGGIAGKTFGTDMGTSVGKFGMPTVPGKYGPFIQNLRGGNSGMAVWDEEACGISVVDYSCSYALPLTSDPTGQQQCLASGINRTGGNEVVWFVSENKNGGQRFLYLVNSKNGKLLETKTLNPALHISKGSRIVACGGSAAIIYVLDGGKLYAYGWENETEREIALPGLNGTPVFVTDQWFSNYMDPTYNFDNLIVGTQDGNNYTLYFYDSLVGGAPKEAPYRTLKGQGKVKSIRRCTPSTIGFSEMMMGTYGSMPIFTTSE